MKPQDLRSVRHARWFSHVNGVNPSRELRRWLTDRRSLTDKLVAGSSAFRVRRLHQRRALSLSDEFTVLGSATRSSVKEREVLLVCDDRALVFAHTIVPLNATASDWPFFTALGERSLGTTLFGDPQVQRGVLQFARLRPGHPLARRALRASGSDAAQGPLYARRCLFKRKNGLLLVTEVFLPAISNLKSSGPNMARTPRRMRRTLQQPQRFF
ncbi:hypothetical protein BH11PSE11_BH11PSE11_01130 [soil metagenome]